MSSILAHIGKYVVLTEEEEAVVMSVLQSKKLRKRQYLLQQGDVARYDSFVVKGCLRAYKVDDKGDEHVIQFAVEGWWIGDMYSFLSGTPSALNIDCLEDSELLQVTQADLEELYQRVPKLERYFRILIQNAYLGFQRRLLSGMIKNALERYEEFVRQYPDIEQRVPNHQIASYLGITPESLSRVRKQAAQKQKT